MLLSRKKLFEAFPNRQTRRVKKGRSENMTHIHACHPMQGLIAKGLEGASSGVVEPRLFLDGGYY